MEALYTAYDDARMEAWQVTAASLEDAQLQAPGMRVEPAVEWYDEDELWVDGDRLRVPWTAPATAWKEAERACKEEASYRR